MEEINIIMTQEELFVQDMARWIAMTIHETLDEEEIEKYMRYEVEEI